MKKPLFCIVLLLTSILSRQVAAGAELPISALKKVKQTTDSLAVFKLAPSSTNRTFRYQQGQVQLPGGLGELTVPAGFRYLDSAQASYVLHELWHNPPQPTLGMLFPLDSSPLGAKSWAYVLAYNPTGHISEAAADSIEAGALLKQLQQDATQENAARTAAGYEPVYVAGWGAKPYYDKQLHALHWAKLLRYDNGLGQALNYNVRVLARKGVLVFNAVADPSLLPEIQASIPALLASVQLAPGQRYNDFNPGQDPVATSSIKSLIVENGLTTTGIAALAAKHWQGLLLALGALYAAFWRVRRFSNFGS